MVLAILIHDPSHRLGRGAHVGGRDIDIGAEEFVDCIDESAREPLQLPVGELGGIDGDASFGAAVGNVDNRRLPRHQGCQPPHLLQVDLRMVTQASLHRAPGVVVLHAIADVGEEFSGVEFHRNLHLHLAAGGEEQLPHVGGEIELVGGPVEIDSRGITRSHGYPSKM